MIGIDVAKDSLSVACWDDARREIVWTCEVPNTVEGLAELVARTAPDERWALEPTGRYSELAVRTAWAHNRQALLAPPKAAKKFLESLSLRAKTDKLDAKGIARYAALAPLRPFVLKDDEMDELSQLLSVRHSLARSLATFRQQRRSLPRMKEQLQQVIDDLAKQLAAVDRELEKRARRQPAIKRLRRVPGIGLVTATALIIRLQSMNFVSYDAFVAYIGLDLKVCDSGEHRGERHLSHQGDAELRRLLYCCAQATLRSKGSPFKLQYERELAKNLPTTGAFCAVARKLAKVAWAMVRSGKEYDAERVYRRPGVDTKP